MLEILNINNHVNVGLAIGSAGFDVAYIGVVVADYGGNLLQHSGAVVAKNRQLYRISRAFAILTRPFHRNAAIGVIYQVSHISTAARMHRHAFTAGDIANYIFAANGIAASRPVNKQIVVAFYLYGVVVTPKNTPHHAGDSVAFFFVCFSRLLGCDRHQFRKHLPRRKLAVANAGQQVLSPAEPIICSYSPEFFFFYVLQRDAVFARFLFDQLASDLDGAFALMNVQPVFDLVARAGRLRHRQPVPTWVVPGLREDLDDIAAMQPVTERHHAAVHFS